MGQSRIEKIRIFMLVAKAGCEPEAGLAVQRVIIRSAIDQSVHHASGELEGVMVERGVQHRFSWGAVLAEISVRLPEAGPVDEGLLEDGDVIQGVRGAVHHAMGLPGEKPEQLALNKLIPVPADDIRYASASDDIQLELRMVVSGQPWDALGRIGEKDKASIAFTESQVFQHADKI